MYMLDTDTCSYIIRERPLSVLEKFKHLDTADLCISVITQAELIYGVERSQSKKVNRTIIQDFISRLVVFDWDSDAAEAYGALRVYLEKQGTPIGTMDLMIAAHSVSINAVLVTNNTRHFGLIPDLQTENWVA